MAVSAGVSLANKMCSKVPKCQSLTEALQKEGRLRSYGISTNSLDVLKRFNKGGGCKVVQVDYSLVAREPEAEFLPYCHTQKIAVMVRGPLARGLLSGRYTRASTFDDDIRSAYNEGGAERATFEKRMDSVDRLRELVEPDDMIQTSLQYVISHPSLPVAIPGAKSVEQATANAVAGDDELSDAELERLRV